MYKNYLFDLYGTLLTIRTDEDSEGVWEKMALFLSYSGANYDPTELRNKYNKCILKMLNTNNVVEVPGIDIQDVFYKLLKDKDVKPKKRMARDFAKVFRVLTTQILEPMDGVVELFEAIKEKKGRIYLMANAQNAYALPELRTLQIRDYFDGYFLSSDLGVCKPDKMFIEAVFGNDDLKKKDSIVISADYQNDIEIARQNGVHALYLNNQVEQNIIEADGLKVVAGKDVKQIISKLFEG